MNSTQPIVESGKEPAEQPDLFVAEVVDGEPATQSPRIRFGIGTLLVMTAVLGGQFALISYLNPLWALVVPPLVCLGTVIVIWIVHVKARASNSGLSGSQLAQRTFKWGFFYVCLLGTSAYMAGGANIAVNEIPKWLRAKRVHLTLGFDHVERYGMIHVTSITPGGAFETAEFQVGDAIVSELSPRELIFMLDEDRGQTISVTVASGALTRALEDCPQRELTLTIQ